MSADIAIRIENLGKRYRYGGVSPLSYSLRQDITDWLKGLFRRPQQPGGTRSVASEAPARHETLHEVHERHLNESPEYFWALKDINLEIKQGEVLGIIGRNGAGKSTLLKILSRITPPTTGKITYNGRIASLLEVGTGFHRELTGRENIYLNGSILGMKRAEITRKLDEIIAFAEVEKFIDTPVKFYSSGMYVRLAFAVAAHLEPEILVVDEVLAVGDAGFQRKCLGKMGDIVKKGRTVLFVTHNMGAVSSLCRHCIWLDQGQLQMLGQSESVIERYLKSGRPEARPSLSVRTDRSGTGEVRLVDCQVTRTPDGSPVYDFRTGDDLYILLTFEAEKETDAYIGVRIKDGMGRVISSFHSREIGFEPTIPSGQSRFVLHVPSLPLLEGHYSVDGSATKVSNAMPLDQIEDIVAFTVYPNDCFHTGSPFRAYHGIAFLPHEWHHPNGFRFRAELKQNSSRTEVQTIIHSTEGLL